MDIFAVDWQAMFLPERPFLEIFVRGTVVYLALFLILRFVVRREAGSLGITDLLVIVLLADATQNAMSSDYQSIMDGLFLVGTIVFWSYLLNWLAFRYSFFRQLVKPEKLMLIKDGRILRRHLEKEMITEEELMSEIRSHGVDSKEEVREAYIEPDGMISVIAHQKSSDSKTTKKRRSF